MKEPRSYALPDANMTSLRDMPTNNRRKIKRQKWDGKLRWSKEKGNYRT